MQPPHFAADSDSDHHTDQKSFEAANFYAIRDTNRRANWTANITPIVDAISDPESWPVYFADTTTYQNSDPAPIDRPIGITDIQAERLTIKSANYAGTFPTPVASTLNRSVPSLPLLK